eukprot:m.793755 g.793755  ORF g.793755 m.793755 type:complete len:324 (-) comp23337_c0_seq1:2730-3701(-)
MSKYRVHTAVALLNYTFAPFFGWPHKPILHCFFGTNYNRALDHFRRDHSDPLNIILHLMCLVLQLGANFALTSILDDWISREISTSVRYDDAHGIDDGSVIAPVMNLHPVLRALASLHGVRGCTISRVTAVVWCGYLLMVPTNVIVRALSTACIVAAYVVGPTISSLWIEILWITGVLHVVVLKYHRFYTWTHRAPVLLLFAARYGLQVAAMHTHQWISFDSNVKYSNIGLCCGILFLSHRPWTRHPNCFYFGVTGWAYALLTMQPWVLFWSTGFLASSLQGCAHKFTGQMPTMPQLSANLADELGHTVFFPNLLFETALFPD